MIQGAESAIWLRGGRFKADGWLYFSNFSCSFLLLVIYENNFHLRQRYKCWCVQFHLTPAGLLEVSQGKF